MKLPVLLLAAAAASFTAFAAGADRPNILWITSEDNGPHLGCYGDKYADTPNLDRLAARRDLSKRLVERRSAPPRTTIISGVYPPATGSEHMRSSAPMPPFMKMYPQYLREAGYYCTNNSKEDYNLEKPGQVWDESSGKAHWRNRRPDQPFFAIFNFTVTHESQVRKRPHKAVHDPAKVAVPAYHPDTPEVRQDWAQYHDKITEMDRMAGKVLQELDNDGLAGETIVFYYGDHGPGMPRSSSWPYNSGLRVPMIVSIPPKWKRLARPTASPAGRATGLSGSSTGADAPEPRRHQAARLHAGARFPRRVLPARPEILVRLPRQDGRALRHGPHRGRRAYVYLKHYMPHRIYGQHVAYMFETPTTRVWKRLYDAGKLKPPMTYFWQTKPAEELYDLQNDPDEVDNLADSPQHQEVLARMRAALRLGLPHPRSRVPARGRDPRPRS